METVESNVFGDERVSISGNIMKGWLMRFNNYVGITKVPTVELNA